MDKMLIAKTVRNELEFRSRQWWSDPHTLDALCGIASLSLADLFNRFGFKAEVRACLVGGIDHCFVVCEGEIWDLTIRQFDNWRDAIYVCGLDDEDFGHLLDPTDNNPERWDWPVDNKKAAEEIVEKALKRISVAA